MEPGSCPGAFSNRHCQQLTSLRFVTRALGSRVLSAVVALDAAY
jgi:hypothetical protein